MDIINKVKDCKSLTCLGFAVLSVSALFAFFLLGGTNYIKEHPKLFNYNNTMCKVHSTATKSHMCSSGKKYKKYQCYGTIWNVYHGDLYLTLATIEDQFRFRDYPKVLQRSYEYKVRK